MKEIEVKARLDRPDEVKAKLLSLGWRPAKTVTQDDRVFIKNGIDYDAIPPGTIFLRLREQNGQALFTFKRRLKKDDELQCQEYETVVEQPEAMADMLSAMDFYEAVRVKKRRESGKLGHMLICLDEVDGLGCFAEVEVAVDEDAQGDAAQEDMLHFLEEVGVSRGAREAKGYDTLIHLSRKSRDAG